MEAPVAELWLPLEGRVARWDPVGDQLQVTGWRAGPAGVSAMELDAGLLVAVDHASPSTLSELSVDVEDGRVPDRLVDLIAALVGDQAMETLRRMPGGTERPVQLRTNANRRLTSFRRQDPALFGRFALGADLGDDAGRSTLARGLSLAEGALAGLDLHRAAAIRLARRAVEALDDADLWLEEHHQTSVRKLLGTLGLRLDPDPVGAEILALAARFSGRLATTAFGASSAAAAPAAAAAPMAARTTSSERVDLRGRPLAVDGDHRAWAWLDEGGNVRITAGASARNTWARVFRRDDRVLLGLSPVRQEGRDAGQLQAVVVIPPTPPDALVVDLVADPSQLRPAPAQALVRDAVRSGRHAARLTRLGDQAGAGESWEECARRWDRLGDTQRATLARTQGVPRGNASAPLLSDQFD
jgi:hypothetical protein